MRLQEVKTAIFMIQMAHSEDLTQKLLCAAVQNLCGDYGLKNL